MAVEPEATTEFADGPGLEVLLDYLKDARGFDFSNYKRPTLQRRIGKRMDEVEVADFAAYADFLEANPREFAQLFNTILINVTGFFRDPEAWDYLAAEVVPRLLASIPDEEPIRVWSAGCSSGEEAYTAALVLLEALGEEAFKERVKIYATDLDEEALAEARAASFTEKRIEDVPAALVERYFVEDGRGFSFRPDLRRSVIFGRNELLEDAPISRIDLLLCRNVLMYFTADAQTRILAQLNFALRERGFLFLGRSELLVRHSDCFVPVDTRHRVFHRIPRRNLGERIGQVIGDPTFADEETEREHTDLRRAAAAIGPVARLVVDPARFLVDANQRAGELFGVGAADLGRPLQDLELSYRPIELRASLDRAFELAQPVSVGRVDLGEGEAARILEVEVTPITIPGQPPLGAAISYLDVTEVVNLAAEHGQIPIRVAASDGGEGNGGAIVAEVSREIVRIHSHYYGRGPTKAKTIWRQDVVVCVLEEIFTRAEQLLVDAGRFEQVRSHRQAFQDQVEPIFRVAVETATGHSVVSFLSQVAPDGVACEVFTLGPLSASI